MTNTILLVDDDPTTLRLLKTLLEIEGFEIRSWAGEGDIIPQISNSGAELVIMDVNLRTGNGIDILRKLKKNGLTAHVPVIMTSGMDCKKECLAAGAATFILKPYMPDQLIASIRSALEQEGQHAE